MSKYIKTCRENAGLTQEKLAEKMGVTTVSVQNWESGKTKIELSRLTNLAAVFNVPVENLIKEMLIEEDKKCPDRWPRFLFNDDETNDINDIIDTLHLNFAQQELFGLLYIYNSGYLKEKSVSFNTLYDDLKLIPYGFIDKVGSIRFMNQVDGLHKVLRYVQAEFLMKVLKQNPEAEFNIKKLPKDLICEFIDSGYKPPNDMVDHFEDLERYEADESLVFHISMKKAKIILPVLEKKEIHLTDGNWANEPRKDIPKEVLDMCDFQKDLWEGGYYGRKNNCAYILSGIETVTDYGAVSGKGKVDQWFLEINEKGKQLLEWFREK